MANLNETDVWAGGIYQLEEDDPVLGGPTGIDNLAPRQLASRTLYQRLRNVTPWDATLPYPANVAYVSYAGSTWKSVGESINIAPGSDPAKWVRWGFTLDELTASLGDAVSAHEGKADAHPQYATDADLAAHLTAPNPHPLYATDADLAAHVAAPNPHGQYVRHDAAQGLTNDQATQARNNISAETAGAAAAALAAATGRLLNIQAFTVAGTYTYTKTPGTRWIEYELCGAGSPGAGTPAVAGGSSLALGGGGCAGSYARGVAFAGFDGAIITVGAKGVGAANSAGSPGGSSSIGALASAPGGVVGNVANILTPGTTPTFDGGTGLAAAPTGGNLVSARGGPGTYGIFLSGSTSFASGPGGASYFGAGATPRIGSAGSGPGIAASSPGAGGSGALTTGGGAAFPGGNGADGIVIVREYT